MARVLGRGMPRLPTALILGVVAAWTSPAVGCPFCGAVGESLAMRRDAAAVFAVGESAGPATPDPDGRLCQPFRIDQTIRGTATAGGTVRARVDGPLEGTALLFGTGMAATPEWSAVAANEALLGYVIAAPPTAAAAPERLRWFARRLEHPEPAIAADAFTEYGLAPFDAVRESADAFDPAALAAWLDEPGIDERRRGFYGLAAGVVAARQADPAMRRRLLAALHAALDAPRNDFRAGFDGLLAGLLVAEGASGLDRIADRGLFRPDASALDQRHLLAALRFATESLTTTVPRDRIVAATARLIHFPGVAADAVVDLARLQAWESVGEVADLWTTVGRDDPLVRRAVAGYLAACPLPEARRRLDALRAADPVRLEAALESARSPFARP